MPVIKTINELKRGDKLLENVNLSTGGTIFKKGLIITPRHIEILKAFQIQIVTVETIKEGKQHQNSKEDELNNKESQSKKGRSPFEIQVYKMVELLQKVFLQVKGGGNLSLLETREAFQPLVDQILKKPGHALKLHSYGTGSKYDYYHAIVVGLLSVLMAKWSKISEKEYMQVAFAGLFHDIGKLKVDPRIINKKGTLTVDEFEEIKTHTVNGYHILTSTPGLNEGVAFAALQHHERMDGSGYPLSLRGEQIHLYSKIVAILEVYHSMVSELEYKKALSPFVVTEHLIKDNLGKLDPKLVYTFVEGMMPLFQDCRVQLNNGEVGKIVFINKDNPTRPMIQIYDRFINLVEQTQYHIEKVMI